MDRCRHENIGLTARIAEHQALIARTLILVARSINALGNIHRLGMNVTINFGILPVETVLLVTDRLDGSAGNFFHTRGVNILGATDFAGHHDPIGGGQGLDSHTALGVTRQECIDNGIGNPIANLVGMSLRHGLTGKKIISFGHGNRPPCNRYECQRPETAFGWDQLDRECPANANARAGRFCRNDPCCVKPYPCAGPEPSREQSGRIPNSSE